jgi:hypothetical protein
MNHAFCWRTSLVIALAAMLSALVPPHGLAQSRGFGGGPKIVSVPAQGSGATAPEPGQSLQVATFNLTPRTPLNENLEQVRAAAADAVQVVKTMLYAQSGEAAANKEGRRLWYDPNTLTLTITDYPSNIKTVSDYVRSLPTMGQKQKSAIIPLQHQTASETQDLLQRVTGAGQAVRPGQAALSVTKTMRVEGELTFRDLRIRITRVNENNAADKNDDSVEMVVRTPTTSEDRTIQEFRSEFIGDYEINVIEVRPSGTPGEGSARIEVRYAPPATGAPAGPR